MSVLRMRPVATGIALVLIFCSCDHAAKVNIGTSQSISIERLAVSSQSRIADNIQDLDAPTNPYAGQYKDWDRWFFEHLAVGVPKSASNGASWAVLNGCVDANGNLVPLTVTESEAKKAATNGRSKDFFRSWPACAYAEGRMESQLYADYETATWKVKSQFYPRIPTWLGEDVPSKAMLLPDGRVVTVGDLGSGQAEKMSMGMSHDPPSLNSPALTELDAVLFDSAGKELARTEGGAAHLYDLLNAQFPEVIARAKAEGWDGRSYDMSTTRQGYLVFKGSEGTTLLTYDYYRGGVVEETTVRDEHNFVWIPAGQLENLYAAQRH